MEPSAQMKPIRDSLDLESFDKLKKRVEAARKEHIEFLNRLLDDETEQSKHFLSNGRKPVGHSSNMPKGVRLSQVCWSANL